jgi:hypothetical protein
MRRPTFRFREYLSQRGVLIEDPPIIEEPEKGYRYNEQTGELAVHRVLFCRNTLEKILSFIRESPFGARVQLYFAKGSHKVFERVKRIRYLPGSRNYQAQ